MAEKQLELDIEILKDKIDNKFEIYTPISPVDITPVKEELDVAQDQNTIVQLSKYLSQVEGRIRCYEMRNASRDSLFESLQEHRKGQLLAYENMDAKFKSYGGILG